MAIAGAQVTNRRHAVCYLDLDHFKTINDERGYDAGEALLREPGVAMESAVPVTAWIARLGGWDLRI